MAAYLILKKPFETYFSTLSNEIVWYVGKDVPVIDLNDIDYVQIDGHEKFNFGGKERITILRNDDAIAYYNHIASICLPIDLMNEKRITFRNKKIILSKMTHSHVSNCYWFSLLIEKNHTSANIYKKICEIKFNNVILPYSPHPDFDFEIKILYESGYLISTSNGYDIMYKNEKIGSINIFDI